MNLAHHRHDISGHVRGLLEPWLPGRQGCWGGVAHDHRRFINAVAVFWIVRTGAAWRDDRDWKNTHRRFCRWRDKSLPLRRQGASGRGCWSSSWMSLTVHG